MNFTQYLAEITELLQNKYPNVDFTNDCGVNNKLNDLVWIVCHRINSPDPIIKENEPQEDLLEDWRKGAEDY